MTAKELVKYLKTFSPKSEVRFIVADIENRTVFKAKALTCITDYEAPVFCIEIGDPEAFNEMAAAGGGGEMIILFVAIWMLAMELAFYLSGGGVG